MYVLLHFDCMKTVVEIEEGDQICAFIQREKQIEKKLKLAILYYFHVGKILVCNQT